MEATEQLVKLAAAAADVGLRKGTVSQPALSSLLDAVEALALGLQRLQAWTTFMRQQLRLEVARARVTGVAIPSQYRRRNGLTVAEKSSRDSAAMVETGLQQLSALFEHSPVPDDLLAPLLEQLRAMTGHLGDMADSLQRNITNQN